MSCVSELNQFVYVLFVRVEQVCLCHQVHSLLISLNKFASFLFCLSIKTKIQVNCEWNSVAALQYSLRKLI